MAMAVCNKRFEEKGITDWIADSAGLACTGGKISPNSAKALEKIGININNYTSKQLDFEMINSASLLVVMTFSHKTALLSAGVDENKVLVLGQGIPDPYGGSLEVYESCLKAIILGVDSLFEEGVFK